MSGFVVPLTARAPTLGRAHAHCSFQMTSLLSWLSQMSSSSCVPTALRSLPSMLS